MRTVKMNEQDNAQGEVAILILAGGQSRRMAGENKALMKLGDESLITCLLHALRPQARTILVSANGLSPDDLLGAFSDIPLLEDRFEGFQGPLAGIEAGLSWLRTHDAQAKGLISLACDAPFIPLDLVENILTHLRARDHSLLLPPVVPIIAPIIAMSKGRAHWTHGFWPQNLLPHIQAELQAGQNRLGAFVKKQNPEYLLFPCETLSDGTSLDPFMNINTVEDLQKAQKIQQLIDGPDGLAR